MGDFGEQKLTPRCLMLLIADGRFRTRNWPWQKFLNKRAGVSRPYRRIDLQAANEPTNPVILVVDDDDAARLMARSALEKNGFDVLEA